MSDYPSGPLPADLDEYVAKVAKELGNNATAKMVRLKCEEHYKQKFEKSDLAPSIAKVYEVKKPGKKAAGAKKEKPAKRERATKPDDYPKAALTAYFLFMKDERSKVVAEHPDMSVGDIGKELGRRWQEASDATKAKYQKLSDDDKKRHEEEMKAYLAQGGEVFKRGKKDASEGKGKKAKKDPNAPKRAMNAYMFFAADFRKKHPELSMVEQTKGAGAAWKTMTDEQKKPFEEMSAKDKERYAREMAN